MGKETEVKNSKPQIDRDLQFDVYLEKKADGNREDLEKDHGAIPMSLADYLPTHQQIEDDVTLAIGINSMGDIIPYLQAFFRTR